MRGGRRAETSPLLGGRGQGSVPGPGVRGESEQPVRPMRRCPSSRGGSGVWGAVEGCASVFLGSTMLNNDEGDRRSPLLSTYCVPDAGSRKHALIQRARTSRRSGHRYLHLAQEEVAVRGWAFARGRGVTEPPPSQSWAAER